MTQSRIQLAFLVPKLTPSHKTSRSPPSLCAASPPQAPLTVITQHAAQRGYHLNYTTTGPFLNLSLHIKNAHPNKPVATLSGALFFNRLHVESYKTFTKTNQTALQSVSPSMMLFIAALALASQQNIKSVYGLAIEDAPQQHRRLVAYLKRFGGKPTMRITDNLKSLPARIFYGGLGTIIRGDVTSMLHRGMQMIHRTTQPQSHS